MMTYLTILVHVQVNLIGRYVYLDSVDQFTNANSQKRALPFDVERKFLSMTWWLLNRGLDHMCQRVEAKVEHILAG